MKNVAIGILGSTLDRGAREGRWSRWRPTVALCQHEDLLIDRFELLVESNNRALAREVADDMQMVSPGTDVRLHAVSFDDPWDFEHVYEALHGFAAGLTFDSEKERYLVHVTTGTHVAQICLFLLTESRHFPAELIQSVPPRIRTSGKPGSFVIIDLDLSKYDRIAQRFAHDRRTASEFLKAGIETRSDHFNRMIDEIEHVSLHSKAPILLTGPTGAGKSSLARRIYELRRLRCDTRGRFVEVNCATLRGDSAMSTLFGHKRGAFTGAMKDRDGLIREADQGILFLDEIGELGQDEQAMLLRAIEDKTFLPLGADREIQSDFELISGTNRDLASLVKKGRFRDDLLARINLWTFRLPGLAERQEDIEANIMYELEQITAATGRHVRFNAEALRKFLSFARSTDATWAGNFRDLNAAIARMATMAPSGRITVEVVEAEIGRLCRSWSDMQHTEDKPGGDTEVIAEVLGASHRQLDEFDKVQLAFVLRVCRQSRSLSAAGRKLFAESRKRRKSANDADRLRKYLGRFGIEWSELNDNE